VVLCIRVDRMEIPAGDSRRSAVAESLCYPMQGLAHPARVRRVHRPELAKLRILLHEVVEARNQMAYALLCAQLFIRRLVNDITHSPNLRRLSALGQYGKYGFTRSITGPRLETGGGLGLSLSRARCKQSVASAGQHPMSLTARWLRHRTGSLPEVSPG